MASSPKSPDAPLLTNLLVSAGTALVGILETRLAPAEDEANRLRQEKAAEADGSAIAPAIIESCQTRLLLPNERAIEPQITAIYQRFGLNSRQIEILARAMPKRDY